MKLGFSPLTAGLDYRQSFELAAKEGAFLEVAYDVHEMDPRVPDAKALLQMGRAAGVGFSIHLPFVDLNLASLVAPVWQLSLERTQRGIDFGHTIGAQCGVLHTGLCPLPVEEVLHAGQGRLQEALSALELAIPVALENLVLSPQDLLQKPDELLELLNSNPRFGFCLDVGHALVELGPGGWERYYGLLKDRLIHFHLHDNDGTSDQHRVCGEGQVDWAWVRQVLRGFEGTAALETTHGAEGVRRSFKLLRG
jgi:sugar phosphate isomerase/epimerase